MHIHLELRRPQRSSQADFDAKAGLLLLALKDLWTGDLPLGGESSVGRGRLQGLDAALSYAGQRHWALRQGAAGLELQGDEPLALEDLVKAFLCWPAPQEPEGQGVK